MRCNLSSNCYALTLLTLTFLFFITSVSAENKTTEMQPRISSPSVQPSAELTSSDSPDQEDPYAPHRERFEEWAPTYDEGFEQWGVFTPAHDLIIKHLGEIAPSSRILDVACGTGNLSLRLAEIVPDGEVVGLDFSPKMVALAQAKLPPEGANVSFVEGNAEFLPFPDNSFDYITCSYAFHHFPHPEKAVQEMHRVLKDGGRAFLIDPYKIIPGGYFFDWFNRTFFEEGTHHYSIGQLRTMFQENGFEEIEQDRSFRRLHFFVPALLTMGTAEKNIPVVETPLSEK